MIFYQLPRLEMPLGSDPGSDLEDRKSVETSLPVLLLSAVLQQVNRLLLPSTGALRWKEDLQQKASQAFLRQQEAAPNLKKLVYGSGRPRSISGSSSTSC